MSDVAILDLGYGNVESIRLGFARLGADVALVSDAPEVLDSARLVLPGVGAAGYAMKRLRALGLVEALRERRKPLLGICLGMQLLFEASDEADTACLGLVAGRVRAMAAAPGKPIPHMGWTPLHAVATDDANATGGPAVGLPAVGGPAVGLDAIGLDAVGLQEGDHVYFAHSFVCDDGPATVARASYGQPIPAALRQGHLWGAQFHPERSAAPGASFLKAFLSA